MKKTTNKSIVFLGDSITYGVGASCEEKCWASLVTKEGEFSVGHNFGVCGTRIAAQRQELIGSDLETFTERVERLPEETDYVLIFGGTNDYGHGDAPMGRLGDCGADTFYGGMELLLTKLMERYPTARIAVMTPIHRKDENNYWNEVGVRNCGTLGDYVRAEKEVCQKYGIPVLDTYAASGIYPDNEVNRTTYTTDGLHPNDAGHRLIADKVLSFLEYVL